MTRDEFIESVLRAIGHAPKSQTAPPLDVALDMVSDGATVLEFGVFKGESLRRIALRRPRGRIVGFDSFRGLPLDWREGFPAGSFDTDGQIPYVPAPARIVPGLFACTLRVWLSANPGPVDLLHIDCDIYESTATVLELLADRITPETVLVFDELVNYPGFKAHEMRALYEHCRRTGTEPRVICSGGPGDQSVALRLEQTTGGKVTPMKKKPKAAPSVTAPAPAPPSYVAVLPYMHQPYFDACMATCKLDVWAIDNTVNNVGCTAAWNMGLKRAMDEGLDWCVFVSAAVRFGERGGLDFIDALAANPDAHAIMSPAHGHFFAIHRRVTERIGYFDENFWPSYFQDNDWSRRARLAFSPFNQKHVASDVRSESIAHGLKLGGLDVNFGVLEAYYRRKWGACPGGAWAHPFNDETLPLSWWPPPGDPRGVTRPRLGQFIMCEPT